MFNSDTEFFCEFLASNKLFCLSSIHAFILRIKKVIFMLVIRALNNMNSKYGLSIS